jgi:hypothetical protein
VSTGTPWEVPLREPRHRGADLLGNPLTELETLRRPLGVMAAGQWYPRNQLDGLPEAVARDYLGTDHVSAR